MLRAAKIGILFMLVYACTDNGTNGNNPPTLSYQGLVSDTMRQGLGEDAIIAVLSFEDIDGDIIGGSTMSISLVDNRDGTIEPISFPVLPELSKGQKGTFQLAILSTCCIFPPEDQIPACEGDPDFPPNQYTYDIFITDGAGNRSNSVTTDVVTLLCI